MERLKIRQRLNKLNTPPLTLLSTSSPSEKFNIEPTKRLQEEDPSELRRGELASKTRVQSIMLDSIPDKPSRPRKPNSHITPQMIADFQFEENKPIEIDGKIYRIHPASIPEPEFEPITDDLRMAKERINEINSEEQDNISAIVDALEITKGEIANLRVERDKMDSLFNKYVRTFNEERLVARQNKDYKKRIVEISRQMDELDRQYLEETIFVDQEIEDKIRLIDELQIRLQQKRQEKGEIENIMNEQEREVFLIKKRNAQKLKDYEDNLKQLNKNFNLERQVGETEDQYIQRIREATTAIEDPAYVEDRMILHEATKFKNNMKELVRDPTVIEYAYNKILDEKGVGTINELNNLFTLIKSRYQKIYGTAQLKDTELVKFLMTVLSNPVEIVPQEEKEEEQPFKDKSHSLETTRFFTKKVLIDKIALLKPVVAGNPVVRYKGEIYEIVIGKKGALNYVSNGVKKPIMALNSPVLRLVLIDLMEKLKTQNPDQYEVENEEINKLTKNMYGEGFHVKTEGLPQMCKFGNVDLDLHKLFYKNILSIKHNGLKVIGFKNAPVSDEFVSILMNMCKGISPSTRELNKLPERQLYDTLLHIAGVHKKIEHTADKTVEELQKRLTLVEGEIEAGNTNKELLQELRDILYKLHYLGVITQNNLKSHFNDIKKNFF